MAYSRSVRSTSSPSSTLPVTSGIPGNRDASPEERSSSTTTSSEAARSAATTCASMYPAPPVTSQVIGAAYPPRGIGTDRCLLGRARLRTSLRGADATQGQKPGEQCHEEHRGTDDDRFPAADPEQRTGDPDHGDE